MIIGIDITRFLIDTLMIGSIYVILSSSLNLEYSYAGIPNIGKVLFFATGSFTVASLSIRISARILGLSYTGDYSMESRLLVSKINDVLRNDPLLSISLFFLILVIALLVSVVIALLLSYPTIRLRGTYLGVTLLVTGEILRYIARYKEDFIGGTLGSPVIDVFGWIGKGITRDICLLIIYMAISLSTWYMTKRILESPYGRLLKSIRDDEDVSQSLGKDINAIRVRVLALGSILAGLAGVLYAFYIGHIDSGDFTPDKTFLAFLMIIIGGKANPYGPLAGSLFYVVIERTIRQAKYLLNIPFDINYLAKLLLGVVLILFMLFKPRGLFQEKDDLEKLHRRIIEKETH